MQMTHDSQQPRVCPVCGSDSYTTFAEEHLDQQKVNDFTYASRKQPEFMCLRLVQCSECDLVYAPSPPSAEFLTTAYSQAAYDSSVEANAAARSYAKALTRHLRQLPNRHAAVDVGAGSGPLLPWLAECGFSPVIGIEPSQAAIDAALPDIKPMLKKGMFSAELLADVHPSLICSFMTLEHIDDPKYLVETAHALLEPGGMLAVVVHNWRAPLNRLLGLRSPIIDIEHLQLYSPKSIGTLLSRSGFTAIQLIPISNSYPLRYWLRLTPLPVNLKKKMITFLEYINMADWYLPMRVGNLLAVGIKNQMEKS